MPISIVINGTAYQLPVQGDNPPTGTQLTDIIEALAEVANTSTGPGDILTSTFSMSNNVSSPTNITGLSFDSAVVTTARVEYAIKRTTSLVSLVERGVMQITYNSGSSTWKYSLQGQGDAGITFSITNGQMAYTSSNLSGSSHACTLAFSAVAFS